MKRLAPVAAAILLLALAANVAPAEMIGQVKQLPDGTPVATSGVVTYLTTADCYIENPDRCCGIWVQSDTTAVAYGDRVQVAGVVSTVDGERVIQQASIYPNGAPVVIEPLGIRGRWIGGSRLGYQDCVWDSLLGRTRQGYEWGWVPASGLNNTGLLVTTVGTVTASYAYEPAGAQWFYMDDGSGATADLGEDGVLVERLADVYDGDLVSVTGISSVEPSLDEDCRLIRVIRPRSAADIRVLKEAEQPDDCASDEFDSPKLSRWAYSSRQWVSATASPGWLKLMMPENGGVGPWAARQVGVCAAQVDLKLAVAFSPYSSATQVVLIRAAAPPATLPFPSDAYTLATVYRNAWGQGVYIYGAYSVPMSGNTVYLRFYVNANSPSRWYVAISFDGYTYTNGYRSQVYVKPSPLWISLTSENGSATGKPFAAYCDYFRVTE